MIRLTGSDTMVNLVQAWAENYSAVRPDMSIQVAGGGSGVGIAAIAEGLADVAAASREITIEERSTQKLATAVEFPVALDALAVYVHAANPLDSIALQDLAEIYGEGGSLSRWSQLGIENRDCRRDQIIRVGRQNSSGTFAYFREVVLGRTREYRMGSIDQSGSKDVVALVSNTPCAIGYSGMAYATPAVKVLKVSSVKGGAAVYPSAQSAIDGTYTLARRLYLYTRSTPDGETRAFLDWVLGHEGQSVVRKVGFVPISAAES